MATKRLYLTQRPKPIDEVTASGATREQMQKMHDDKTWPQVYDVKKVVGSTKPKIGTTMSEPEVEGYCANAEWQVDIT